MYVQERASEVSSDICSSRAGRAMVAIGPKEDRLLLIYLSIGSCFGLGS